MACTIDQSDVERRALRFHGRVQGVGFRPAAHRLATRLALSGFVRNDAGGVSVELEGPSWAIDRFVAELALSVPAARVDSIEARPAAVLGERGFRIAASGELAVSMTRRPLLPADLGPCARCLTELGDPGDRRHRYPFINCTACGPRFTIVRDLPYDRPRTTMAPFRLCEPCQREYQDPADRRFHAEPNGCPTCGPELRWSTAGTAVLRGEQALQAALTALREGLVVALKGAGGFVLAADAARVETVARLRLRKNRPHRPLAVMVRSLADAERLVQVTGPAAQALTSPARPIVLLPLRSGHGSLSAGLAPGLAPGLGELGVFLPATPLQHLLMGEGPAVLVMTSGNHRDEPIVIEDAEARTRLVGQPAPGSAAASAGPTGATPVADGVLWHDREIHTRADDSVVRVLAGRARVLRRARGFVPDPVPFPHPGPPVLAVGGDLKATVCLAWDGQAVVSQHLGDLSRPQALAFFEETVEKLQRLFGVKPEAVAHDLHPDYASTRWAQRSGLPQVGVQHHHAHVASCLVDCGRDGPVIGVAFDGTGLGTDGTLWGGEILVVGRGLGSCLRLGHLQPLPLPGGEAAIRQPWRLAVAALLEAGESLDLLHARPPPGVDEGQLHQVARLCTRGISAPRATGAGRWFDAVAALTGVRSVTTYEGQAAIELEAVASAIAGPVAPYAMGLLARPGGPFVIDLRSTIRDIADDLRLGSPTALVAARFHETLARAVVASCRRARQGGGPQRVALTGGCFANRRLTERSVALLKDEGFEVFLHERVPPGDGGLSLGQAAVATSRLRGAEERT